jgi:GTP-binding protein
VVAYNKIDVPDSGDYWEFIQEYLTQEEGLPPSHVFAISAATGRGVTELVRGVRGLLEELGPAEVALETDALNRTKLPKRFESDVSDCDWFLGF